MQIITDTSIQFLIVIIMWFKILAKIVNLIDSYADEILILIISNLHNCQLLSKLLYFLFYFSSKIIVILNYHHSTVTTIL